jgi:hypothetical protein
LKLRGGRRWDVSITAPKGADVKRIPIELKMEYPVDKGDREQAKVLPVDKMMQAFYYEHHIPAAELAVDVIEPAPYRLSLTFDLEEEQTFSLNDEYITVKVVADKNPDFKEPIDLQLGKKNRLFELDPVQILPEETEKTIQIRLNPKAMERYKKNKKSKPNWQMYISGIVKGEWVKQGKGRQVQIAKYNEMTPIFVIQLKR